jgi:hypothetical protein
MDDTSDQMNGPNAQQPRGRLRWMAAAVAVVIPLAPIVIGLSLGGGSAPARGTTVASHFTPVSAGSTSASAGQAPSRTAPTLPAGGGTLVAVVRHSTSMRAAPGGRVFAKLATRTEFGSPTAMWVARVAGQWLGVVSPQAGNNRLGWIRAADASLSRVDWQLQVSLSARRLTVLRGGRVLRRYTVAVGAPASPTPTGRFAVTDRLLTGDPAGPYGCCILALSAVAPHVIQGWSGGDRIAIHSTPETTSIGESVSHGCIRLTLAEGRWLINHIPIGTPTLIRT